MRLNLRQFDGLAKLSWQREWLESYRRGEAVAPVCVEMDLTNRCNYGCPNCVWGEFITTDRSHLSREQALDQVRQIAEAGVKAIIFSGGGEPLLHPAAAEAITLAHQLGLDVGLFTNLVTLTDAVTAALAHACTWVRVHLDAVSIEGYRRRHGLGPAALDRVKHNLLRLSEAAPDLELGVGSVVNAETFDELEGLVKLALLTGCRFLQAKHDFDLLARPSYLAWWDGTVVPRLLVLESRYATDDFAIQFTTIDYGRKPIATRCHIHHLATAVNARGEVCYCKRLRDRPEWSAGNLQTESIRRVVAGPLNLRLSAEVTPQNCGIVCPYMDLNELIDDAVSNPLPLPSAELPPRHENFF